LEVTLDDTFGADVGLVRIFSRGASGTTLAQEIPTLVERYLDGSEATQVLTVETALGVRALKRVLLVGELADLPHNLKIIHSGSSQRCLSIEPQPAAAASWL
jgi:hypothetical protein